VPRNAADELPESIYHCAVSDGSSCRPPGSAQWFLRCDPPSSLMKSQITKPLRAQHGTGGTVAGWSMVVTANPSGRSE
jgi:hypothetical protein